ncbi:hypothetical protein [Methylobacterium soli]|uniref:Uncharacterized protein n=1 Tax=Methylobacterium soli TaxID=553447 RepID=A0A6L3SZ92_9HYPH|nr:hypothetical protein [Methylobacterium soli]KAB1077444.1 hypothetical protein F6X53_19220 [Methylobacterium soli]
MNVVNFQEYKQRLAKKQDRNKIISSSTVLELDSSEFYGSISDNSIDEVIDSLAEALDYAKECGCGNQK